MRPRKTKPFLKLASRAAAVKVRPFKDVRRAFRSFSTEEAWTFVVRFKGLRRFCRVDRTKNARYLAERQRAVLDLFHRLYPKNSITPVGLMRVPAKAIIGQYAEEFRVPIFSLANEFREKAKQRIDEKKRGMSRFPVWGVVTEIERRQSPDFKIHQRELRGYTIKRSPGSMRHEKFLDEVAEGVADIIFKESGIRVNYLGNMSNVNGNPLFFEPKITAPERLVDFIKTKPPEERIKLMKLVRGLGLIQPKPF